MLYCFPRSSIKFQGHVGQNIIDFDPNWAFPNYRPVAAFKSLRFALLDLSKAFVMVNHDILLKILHESGISGVVYDWFLVICLKCLSMCHS